MLSKGEIRLAKIISIVNQKGGVGKTTTAVNLAASLGAIGYKTLLIDIDPQGNSTSGVGINKREVKNSSYDIIIGNASTDETIIKTELAHEREILEVYNIDLAAAEIEIVDLEHRESRLKNAILPVRGDYDFILIDCPPSLGLITTNALCLSDSIIVPIQCEYYALEGLSQLMNTVRRIKRQYNDRLEIEGVLLTMYDGRLNLTQQVVREVKKYFPKKVFRTAIPRGVRLSEAPSFGKPIIYFDAVSKGSDAYISLAKEIINKNN